MASLKTRIEDHLYPVGELKEWNAYANEDGLVYKRFCEYQDGIDCEVKPRIIDIAKHGIPGKGKELLHLGENETRWTVVGIVLNNVLTPLLREVVKEEMEKHYTDLKSQFYIHNQTYSNHLPKDYSNNNNKKLNYGNIHNNSQIHGRHLGRYNYDITNAVDLSKLYLQEFMSKMTGFDGSCDMSACLSLMSQVSVFTKLSKFLPDAARDVRTNVRNEWGHCDMSKWNDTKYLKCFKEMTRLAMLLQLSRDKEEKIKKTLEDWRDDGLTLCFGGNGDREILNKLQTDVQLMAKYVIQSDDFHEQEKQKINCTIMSISETVDVMKKDISDLKQVTEETVVRVDGLVEETGTLKTDVKVVKKQQEKLEAEVGTMQKHQTEIIDDLSRVKETQTDLKSSVEEVKGAQHLLEKRVEVIEESIPESSPTLNQFIVPGRSRYFSGRREELSMLEHAICQKRSNDSCRVVAVCGLGGVGKTTLASEFSWRCRTFHPGGTFWINADDQRTLQLSVEELATELKTSGKNFRDTLSKTLHWFRTQKHQWLLIVDNVDELELSEETERILNGKWQQQTNGSILVTTRREPQEIAESCHLSEEQCITLVPLTKEDAVAFLQQRTEREGEDVEVTELAIELGGLPLALEQAAAHIKSLRCSFKQYSQKYKTLKLKLLKQKRVKGNTTQSKNRLAVHTTWLLNFEYISAMSEERSLGQAAMIFMKIASYLSSEDIPIELMNIGDPKVTHADLVNCFDESLGVNQVLEILTKFSLFQWFSPENCLSVHRMVQEVVRSGMSHDEEGELLLSACRVLQYAFSRTQSPEKILAEENSSGSRDLLLWKRLALNACSIKDHIQKFINKCDKEEKSYQPMLNKEVISTFKASAIFYSVQHRQRDAIDSQHRMLEMMAQFTPTLDTLTMKSLIGTLHVPVQQRVRDNLLCHMQKSSNDNQHCKDINEARSVELKKEGNAMFKNQQYADALAKYSEAMTHTADKAVLSVLHCNQAICHIHLKDPQRALTDAEASQKLDDKYAKAYLRKAQALQMINEDKYYNEIITNGSVAHYLRIEASFLHHIFPAAMVKEMIESYRKITPETFASELTSKLYNNRHNITTMLLLSGEYQVPGYLHNIQSLNIRLIGIGSVTIKLKQPWGLQHSFVFMENILLEGMSIIGGEKSTIILSHCQIAGGASVPMDMIEHNESCPGCIRCSNKHKRVVEMKSAENYSLPALGIRDPCSKLFVRWCNVLDGELGGGILTKMSAECHVEDSKIEAQSKSGIEVANKGVLFCRNNMISGNLMHGVYIGPDAGETLIENNVIDDNCGSGVFILQSENVKVLNNKISRSGKHGIGNMVGGSVCIKGNEIYDNDCWGIQIGPQTVATINGNDIHRNGSGGVHFEVSFSGQSVSYVNVIHDHTGPPIHCEYSPVLNMARTKEEVVSRIGEQDFEQFKDLNVEDHAKEMAKQIQAMGVKEDIMYTLPPVLISNQMYNNSETKQHVVTDFDSLCNKCIYCHTKCSSDSMHRCDQCRKVKYCNRSCQRNHWSKHKDFCRFYIDTYVEYVTKAPIKELEKSEKYTYQLKTRTFNPGLVGIGEGVVPELKSTRRFIVKIQNQEGHPYNPDQQLFLYDKTATIDIRTVSPRLYHILLECGYLGVSKMTGKKIFCWASFAEGGKKLRIFTDVLAPVQTW